MSLVAAICISRCPPELTKLHSDMEIAEATDMDNPVFDFYFAEEIPLRDFFAQARHFPMVIQALEGCIARGSLVGVKKEGRLPPARLLAVVHRSPQAP